MQLVHESRTAFTILGLNFDIIIRRDEMCRNVRNKIVKAGLVPNCDVSNLRVT